MSSSDPVLLELIKASGRVEARLAAMDEKLDDIVPRVRTLERREDRRTGFMAALSVAVTTLGVDRIFKLFG